MAATKTQLVKRDIVECAMERPNVVFHSLNSRYPLIDFVYGDPSGIMHAFQATIGKTHPCNTTQVEALEKKSVVGKT